MILSRENGKEISIDSPATGTVALFIWRKTGGILLPLELSVSEARQLQDMLVTAIAKATCAAPQSAGEKS